MKTFNRFFTLLAAATLFAAGCKDDDPSYLTREPATGPGEEVGYLTGAGMNLSVVLDTATETQPDDTGDAQPAAATRTAPDTDAFLVDILDSDDKAVLSTTYGELSRQLAAEPLALAVGAYTIAVRSEQTIPAADWEHPVYGKSKSFAISKAQQTALGEIRCTLQNIKVTLEVSADLADLLSDDTSATISLGDTQLVFPIRNGRAGYFLAAEEVNTLRFSLDGKFADSGAPVPLTKTIAGVKAGQWRKITLVITHADKGEIGLDIRVDSFIQDETIVINGTEDVWEPVYDENPLIGAPRLAWEGHDFADPFRLKASMFDDEGRCTEPFDMELTAEGGVASFRVNISSTNPEFIEALGVANVPESFDLCTIDAETPAYTILTAHGFPLGADLAGATSRSFSLAGAMPMLYNRPGFDGTHRFAFAIADAEGQSSEATLTLVGDRGSETEEIAIEWAGYSFDQVHDVTSDMQIDIAIRVPAGIRSLLVTIDSETLTPTDLESVGLPATFDLADIRNSDAYPTLVESLGTPQPDGLGFPINEQVRDQTELQFCITPFVPLLSGFQGLHKFHLEVTDNDGASKKVTVSLNVQ